LPGAVVQVGPGVSRGEGYLCGVQQASEDVIELRILVEFTTDIVEVEENGSRTDLDILSSKCLECRAFLGCHVLACQTGNGTEKIHGKGAELHDVGGICAEGDLVASLV